MDRTLMMDGKIGDPTYDLWFSEFYEFVRKNVKDTSNMPCPCDMCLNIKYMTFSEVKIHLEKNNFNPKYRRWRFHGESRVVQRVEEEIDVQSRAIEIDWETLPMEKGIGSLDNSDWDTYSCDMNSADEFDDDELETILRDRISEDNVEEDNPDLDLDDKDDILGEDEDPDVTNLDDITRIVLEKLKDSEMPLYKNCKNYTKLSAVVKLYNLKAKNGWSDRSFTDLLELLKDMLPEDNVLPNRTYAAKKILRGIGMKYVKIHACPNDCILYRKEYESLSHCPVCNEWRYKKKEGIPAKVLWYFPIIPRLRRLFANKEDAKLLTWHNSAKPNDGKFRHPADGLEWKHIDAKYPEFGKEPRNLRLALSTDGMNPYGNLSSQHSTWPVLLAIYNLPPYVCMKRKYLMLSLLISGPKEPGNDLDVYLAPLLDDLRTLWDEGVEVFDAYQNSVFNLKAMLLCTISDFPAYGNLCCHTVHGKEACPLCGEDVDSCYLKFSKKQAFLGYRRFLDEDHFYRRQQKPFNGKPEHRPCPKILSGHDVYERVKDIKITYGKKGSKLASRGYKKMSPFFEPLPYWRELSIRHCLDVMHIKKNVCDNIINTLLNVPNKSKDNPTARKDMMDMKIRPELAPQEEGVRIYLPPAAHTLSKKEKIEFCECFHSVKVPEGYSSNISSLVSMRDLRLSGLKSHDCHVLMQQLLAVAIRSILPKKVRYAITRFCFFFNAICNKVIDSTKLDELQNLIVTSLCQFEMYFPPSFFTIMVHLTVHLVREIKYLGPVYLRYQYPFEILMKVYKDYTSNRYRPEGCIDERAIIDEALSFYYTHLSNSELLGIPKNRHSEWMMGKGLRGHVR
ncbi:uncharacterized protein LOC141617963 [Silene latifolia]|uniref:uncharacterized protein LOC141617963 n=1 Tax=Silene latifolia TaxID=37657 RepID=UPI003D778950